VNGKPAELSAAGSFARIAGCKAGDRIEMTYPLALRTESVTIGNKKPGERPEEQPAFKRYTYRVTWKGDTVVRIVPEGKLPARGYSDFEKREIDLYYGEEGPGRLYRRDHMLDDVIPTPAKLHMDTSPIDYWTLR
jgi:hypothetical protein